MGQHANRKQNEALRKRRGAYFKQLLGDLHLTHGEFTDKINKHIKNPDDRLADSKKVSDWIANGIPGPRTPMKARLRQLAIIEVFGIEKNSDEHKMLVGRMPIPPGFLEEDAPISALDAPADAEPVASHAQATVSAPEAAQAGADATHATGIPPTDLPPAHAVPLRIRCVNALQRHHLSLFVIGLLLVGIALASNVRTIATASTPVDGAKSAATHTPDETLHNFADCQQTNLPASPASLVESRLRLENGTKGQKPLTIYWLNFKRQPIAYAMLTDRTIVLDTFVGHAWLVKNEDGQCLTRIIHSRQGDYHVRIE